MTQRPEPETLNRALRSTFRPACHVPSRRGGRAWWIAALTAGALLTAFADRAWVQDVPDLPRPRVVNPAPVLRRVAQPPVRGEMRALPFMRFIAQPVDDPAAPPEVWATLNTNEDLERLLERADEIVAAGRPDLAQVLWQRVLDEGGSVLASGSGGGVATTRTTYRLYRPLIDEVERRILSAGPEALRAYRLHADGPARALFKTTGAERERALAQIVQRKFLSSLGDDAAFELACRHLERGEAASAVHVLSRLRAHPDDEIPREAVNVRLAVALSQLGELAAAQRLIAPETAVAADLRPVVAAYLGEPASGRTELPGGDRTNRARLSGLVSGAPLIETWEYRPDFLLKSIPNETSKSGSRTIINVNGQRAVVFIENNRIVQPTAVSLEKLPDLTREQLLDQWKAEKWFPSGQLEFGDTGLVLRAEQRIVCCDRRTGNVVWMGRKNAFPLDGETQQALAMLLAGYQMPPQSDTLRPQSPTEVMLFGDRGAQSVSVAGDVVVAVEGALNYGVVAAPQADAPQEERVLGGIAVNEAQTSRNWLAAYDARTGKLRWHRAAGEPAPGAAEALTGSVLGSPLPLGELLFIPIADGGRLGISAVERSTGRTVWNSPLCDLPTGLEAPWTPVGLAESEGTLFVSTGAGAVFALSALDGRMQWAVAYPRRLPEFVVRQLAQREAMNGNAGGRPSRTTRSEVRWNTVLADRGKVIVLAVDADHIFALDAATGEFRWESPLAPGPSGLAADYCLGLDAGRLFVGGPQGVRCLDAEGGRIVWETPLESSYGEGLLAADGVYVPRWRQVVRLDPATGAEAAAADVATANDAPLGNLFTDGERLYAVGPARITAIVPADSSSKGSGP